MIKLSKKQLSIYIFVILCNLVLLFFICFSIYTLNAYNFHKNRLNVYVSSINKINLSAFSSNNGQSIDLDSMKKKFPETITALSKLENNLEQEHISDKYKSVFSSLKLGLKNNILMYKNLFSIINNLEATDVFSSMNTVMNYEKNCNYYYSNIKSPEKCFSLPAESTNNIKNTYSYVAELSRFKKNTAIANTEKLEFENNINIMLENFNSVKVNLNYYAESARKKTMSYDNAISKTLQIKNRLNNLMILCSGINVPAESVEIYSSFKNVLSGYADYVDTFYSALIKEKSNFLNLNNASDYSALFKTADKKFEAVNETYEKFKKELSLIES